MPSAKHNFLLVFQPAEETTGGARDVCESGIFGKYGVEAIFGMHLWPDLPAGEIASRENEMMSRSCEITAEFTGKSSHIAKAEQGIDALQAGVEFVQRVRQIEADWSPEIYRLAHFGRMESGSVRNAVSGFTRLEGTMRAFQDEVFYAMLDRIRAAAQDVAGEIGCTVRFTTSEGYPAVMNPSELCRRVRDSGVEYRELERPVMITEDFSWYQKRLPGMFFFLGTGPSPALHSDNFNFDESVLDAGADFLEKIALQLN